MEPEPSQKLILFLWCLRKDQLIPEIPAQSTRYSASAPLLSYIQSLICHRREPVDAFTGPVFVTDRGARVAQSLCQATVTSTGRHQGVPPRTGPLFVTHFRRVVSLRPYVPPSLICHRRDRALDLSTLRGKAYLLRIEEQTLRKFIALASSKGAAQPSQARPLFVTDPPLQQIRQGHEKTRRTLAPDRAQRKSCRWVATLPGWRPISLNASPADPYSFSPSPICHRRNLQESIRSLFGMVCVSLRMM